MIPFSYDGLRSFMKSKMCLQSITPPESEDELIKRGLHLAGKTLGVLAKEYGVGIPTNLTSAKGWVGQFLEKLLGATAKSKPKPDFELLDIELKTIPVSLEGKPCESTYVCHISLCQLSSMTWLQSLVKRKLSKVFWVPVAQGESVSLPDRILGTPLLWSPTHEQEAVLKSDWEELTDMIALGQLEEIKGSMGTYLQVRPKAANSRSTCWGLNSKGELFLTLPRGFYLRSGFTENILKEHYHCYVGKRK